MDVMSVQDAAFLHIENGNNPMHIGSVAVLEGPAPAYGDLVRLIAAKLALVPRYRQKVRFAPGGIGRPVWVDDPHFQILYHIRHTAVPPSGRPRRASQPRRQGVRADARPGQAALGVVDGRGARRRSLGGHLEGAPLHGGRGLRNGPDDRDVRRHRWADARCAAGRVGAGARARRLQPRRPGCRSRGHRSARASSRALRWLAASPQVRKPVLRRAQRCCARSRSGADARPHR